MILLTYRFKKYQPILEFHFDVTLCSGLCDENTDVGHTKWSPGPHATRRGRFSQERNEVRWRLEQEASLAPPCSNLRSFGSKYTLLNKVLATFLGLLAPPAVT